MTWNDPDPRTPTQPPVHQYPTPSSTPTAPPSQPPASSPTPPAPPVTRRRSRFGLGVAAGVALSAAVAAGGLVVVDTGSSPVGSEAVGTSSSNDADLASFASVGDLVEEARPSIVSIHQTVTQRDPFGNVQEGVGAGTGFVLDADGYIVTNSHVVAEGDDTVVEFDDGSTEPAQVVAQSPALDLAVLRVQRTGLTPLAVGSSDDLQLGDRMVAIGYALDLNGEPTVTTGVLSGKKRSLATPNGQRLVNLLQTDTAINPGNSGGPLLNERGEVIGINTAVAGQAQNIGFAIAISQAEPLIAELKAGSVPKVAFLGVASQQSADPNSGAEIVEVTPGSAADTAGIQVGDVVTEIDGMQVEGPDEVGTVIARHRPDDDIDITVQRDGGPVVLGARLGTRPN